MTSVAWRQRWLLLTVIAALFLPQLATATKLNDSEPAVIPSLQDEIFAQTPEGTPTYTINATLTPSDDNPTIDGTVVLEYINTTGEEQERIPFRLYANGSGSEDELTISEPTVNGEPAELSDEDDVSVSQVMLETPLAPDKEVTIGLTFHANVPIDTDAHYGIFGVDSQNDTWALAHWYPILAGWDPDRGWMLDPTSANGDPIFSTTSLYQVSLTAPEDWRFVTSGVSTGEPVAGVDGLSTRHFAAGPVRDFTVVADDNAEFTEREVGGVTVRSWYNPGQEQAGEAVADTAALSIEIFSELLGQYPYTELELVATPLNQAAGVEFPGLIYMLTDYYDQPVDLSQPSFMEFTVAHEVIHQWFYGLVGNDQYYHAFIDEGLTNFLSAYVFYERKSGPEVAAEFYEIVIGADFVNVVQSGGDQVVDQRTDGFPSEYDYVWAAYTKAPMGFKAIHDEMGEDAFFAGLQAYVAEFSFRVAAPADLRDALAAQTDVDVAALWTHWFEEANGEDDI